MPQAATPANRVGLRIAASMSGALVLFLVLLAIARPEMMGMTLLANAMGLGWYPS